MGLVGLLTASAQAKHSFFSPPCEFIYLTLVRSVSLLSSRKRRERERESSTIIMATPADPRDKIALITKNLQEVLNPELLEDVIVKEDRPLVVYWGQWYC